MSQLGMRSGRTLHPGYIKRVMSFPLLEDSDTLKEYEKNLAICSALYAANYTVPHRVMPVFRTGEGYFWSSGEELLSDLRTHRGRIGGPIGAANLMNNLGGPAAIHQHFSNIGHTGAANLMAILGGPAAFSAHMSTIGRTGGLIAGPIGIETQIANLGGPAAFCAHMSTVASKSCDAQRRKHGDEGYRKSMQKRGGMRASPTKKSMWGRPNSDGEYYCKICGKSYKYLGQHLKKAHDKPGDFVHTTECASLPGPDEASELSLM
ncbi:unnamed protein product [Vitrella brassicaformis CCMP3155]|uniref:Uncharacterized protein n=1 Tax=Vitrella brassicaformis (strain CCMP3155) TaxID=1169540 RepID=A0A0G4EMN7_VITBC|nr:unnamed protein product [Vitrella brassicaformis CCMP3155]|eukprot:CEL98245.1 unnamed protein product [Vitrella brassicaformis CCMP3155]